MVGMIPKVLISWVRKRGGESAVSQVKKGAGIADDLDFRLNEVYDDDAVMGLFSASKGLFKLTEDELFDQYADAFMTDAMERFRKWRRMAPNARSFLERQPAIHNGFATAVQDPVARKAITDKFHIVSRPDEIITHYNSPNQLCGLYKALARWVLAHYGEDGEVEETSCQKLGASECEIHIRWHSE